MRRIDPTLRERSDVAPVVTSGAERAPPTSSPEKSAAMNPLQGFHLTAGGIACLDPALTACSDGLHAVLWS